MQYRATKSVNLGGGQYLIEGQYADLPAGISIPGLEPVLERVPSANAVEAPTPERNLDAPGRGKVVAG